MSIYSVVHGGTSLAVQWLKLRTSTPGGVGLIPGQGTKILHAVCVPAQSLSCVQFSATLWTLAHQAPLSMEFSRQEYWSGLPFPSTGDLLNPGIEPVSLASPALAGRFFMADAPGKPPCCGRTKKTKQKATTQSTLTISRELTEIRSANTALQTSRRSWCGRENQTQE